MAWCSLLCISVSFLDGNIDEFLAGIWFHRRRLANVKIALEWHTRPVWLLRQQLIVVLQSLAAMGMGPAVFVAAA